MNCACNIIDETAPLAVGTGTLTAKMKRGSFTLHDRNKVTKDLPLILKEAGTWKYGMGDDTVTMHMDWPDAQTLVLTFAANPGRNRFVITLKSRPEEHFYGCGEQFTHLDLKGQRVKIWVSEHQNSAKIAKKCIREKIFGVNPDHKAKYAEHQTYIAAPSFLSGDGYFVDCDTDGYAEFSFEKTRTVLSFTEIPRKITIISANTDQNTAKTALSSENGREHGPADGGAQSSQPFCALMERITALTGRANRLPGWVGDGAILAVQGGEKVLLKKLARAQQAGVHVAGIWCQDWSGQIRTKFGTQVYWNWQPDESMYSAKLLEQLHEQNIHFLGYINPYLKRDTPLYLEAVDADYIIRKKDGSVYHVQSTTFDAAMIDLTNPDAYRWYKNILRRNLIDFGLDGWMADFGEYLPLDAVLWADRQSAAEGKERSAENTEPSAEDTEPPAEDTEPSAAGITADTAGAAARMHNVWSALWQKCNREAIEESGRGSDIFTFNRAAYRGTLAYANSYWNGDQHVDWSDEYGLGSVIPATLSLACIGAGICHSDIGGYTTIMHMKRSAELLIRWAELNVFTPVFRCHEGNRPEENVQFDDASVLPAFAELSSFFVRLKPYRDYVLAEYENHGIPANRPLFFAFSEEWCYTCQTEFLFGNDVVVTPVLREQVTQQTVRLPRGQWIRFFTGEAYGEGAEHGGIDTFDGTGKCDGIEVRVNTPLGQPVAFYRKESRFHELFSSFDSAK